MGYIATGLALTALALNLGHYFSRRFPQLDFPRQYFLMGLGLLLGYLVVKAILAPSWQQLLQMARSWHCQMIGHMS